MNILESANIRSPNEIEEECAHFTITDTEQPFVLNEIAKPDEQYTFSAWVKGSGEISISGNKFPVTADWTKCVITFVSESVNVDIYFNETGEYYLYNSQLEVGEKDTDYSPAPEDLEADAQSKADNALASAKTYTDAQIKASADSVMIAVAQGYATVDAVSGVEQRVTDAEALIEVQAGLIEQKVDVDGVIAAINLSKGEARIAADKITLAGYTIADAFTCTNLTVSGNSVFEGVLNGATGVFSGSVEAEKIVISSYIENGDASSYKDTAVDLENIVSFDGMTYFNHLFMSGYQGIVMSSSSYLTETRGEYSEFRWAITEYGAKAYSSLHMGEEKVRPSLFSIDRNGNTIIGSEDVTANLTVTGITKPSIISWYPGNSNYDEVQMRLVGSGTTQTLGIVTYKKGSTVKFYNLPTLLDNCEDSGWKNATLTSQFELYTSSQHVRYRKIGKVVHVEGVLKPTSDIAGSATVYTMFTLPSGYRPARNQIIVCKGSSYYTWLCNCGANGNVTFSRYGTGSSYATCSTSHWLPFNFTFMVD